MKRRKIYEWEKNDKSFLSCLWDKRDRAFSSSVLLVAWRRLPVIAATDADYSKAFAFVSTLAVIPGASWEQLPRRTRLRNNDAVIDQFLKSNVPNWPAGPSQTQVL